MHRQMHARIPMLVSMHWRVLCGHEPLTPSRARATTPSVMPDTNSSSADRALVGRSKSGRQLITYADAAPLYAGHTGALFMSSASVRLLRKIGISAYE